MKLLISMFHFFIAGLIIFLAGCGASEPEKHELKISIVKVYDVRTIAEDADVSLSYIPELGKWLAKYRPPCPNLPQEMYRHSVLGLSNYKPDLNDIYHVPDYHNWGAWYKKNPAETYYFDEPLPSTCSTGNNDIDVIEIGRDGDGTYLILRINHYE